MILAYFQYYQCARPHLLLKPPKGGWKMPQSSDLACTLCDPKNKSSWASKFNSIFFHGNWLIFSWVLVQIPFVVFIFFKIKKKILTLDPWLQHHKLILPSMWIEGRYLKFIQYIFLSRTILLKKYFQTEQYFSFCHRKQKKQNKKIPERFQRLLFAQAEVFGLA